MSTTETRYYLQRTLWRYKLLRIAEVLLLSVAAVLMTYGFFRLTALPYPVWIASGVGLIFFVVRSTQLNIFNLREKNLIQYINQNYPEMQESTDLLVTDDSELTRIQQLQKIRNISTFESLHASIKLPNKLLQTSGLLLLAVSIVTAITFFHGESPLIEQTSNRNAEQSAAKTQLSASIKNAVISITPPAYIGLPKKMVSGFDLQVPQGSIVSWNITFSGKVRNPGLIFSGRDSLVQTGENNGRFEIERSFQQSDFYQIAWTNPDGIRKLSDYFQINVIKDQPPHVAVENMNQFVELSMTDNLKFELRATLTDDYGLKDAYVIATVSKGSGESVKFREEKLRFSKPSAISGKLVHGSLPIDLIKLGLDPGDELYFYVEALDNKTPLANRTRTETFFISLQDTAAIATSVDPGLGVDLMPEYFRSQRQIIIDTEKLLKDKSKITKEVFNSKSNDLAHDQKVLRLRYGEFLGEEFESGIGPQADIAADDEGHQDEDDIMKKYGHAHDTENEHNLVEDKKSSSDKGHSHQDQHGKADEDPAKAFLHDHDNQEEETFFTQSIRAKLKAAITIMWDAELHLRLYEPEKSLPFQYKALKLLKEISQDSRIYVHRTGFDPPPLKEEKRLTGDLSEIKNSTSAQTSPHTEHYPYIRKSILGIEQLLAASTISISDSLQDDLSKAGHELSMVALKQPGRYLKALSLLKGITQREIKGDDQRSALIQIRTAFWTILPREVSSPQSSKNTTHGLDQNFLNNLKALK